MLTDTFEIAIQVFSYPFVFFNPNVFAQIILKILVNNNNMALTIKVQKIKITTSKIPVNTINCFCVAAYSIKDILSFT